MQTTTWGEFILTVDQDMTDHDLERVELGERVQGWYRLETPNTVTSWLFGALHKRA